MPSWLISSSRISTSPEITGSPTRWAASTSGPSISVASLPCAALTRRPGNPLEKLGPQPEADVLPLPPMRTAKELPTAEELVASDKAAATA